MAPPRVVEDGGLETDVHATSVAHVTRWTRCVRSTRLAQSWPKAVSSEGAVMEQRSEPGGSPVLSYLDREVVDALNNFEDPAQEWRRLFSEVLGTFFLALVP